MAEFPAGGKTNPTQTPSPLCNHVEHSCPIGSRSPLCIDSLELQARLQTELFLHSMRRGIRLHADESLPEPSHLIGPPKKVPRMEKEPRRIRRGLDSKALSALETTSLDNLTAIPSAHAAEKAVHLLILTVMRLECALQPVHPLTAQQRHTRIIPDAPREVKQGK